MEEAGKNAEVSAHILKVRNNNQESFAALLNKIYSLIESLLSRYSDGETTKGNSTT
jgi:hypothetical protein